MAVLLLGCSRQATDRVVYSELPSALGVRAGAPVMFRGIPVGAVDRIAFDSAGVRVAIRITRADLPLRTQDRIAVRPLGIFGDVHVEITPGPLSAPAAPSGAVLQVVAPDTLAALRAEVMTAIVRAGLEELRDSTRRAARRAPVPRASSSHP